MFACSLFSNPVAMCARLLYFPLRKTGILVFNTEVEDDAGLETVANSLAVNNIDHQRFSAEEVRAGFVAYTCSSPFLAQANAMYSKQLSLQPDVKCVFEKDGGILMAAKAMACYQVRPNAAIPTVVFRTFSLAMLTFYTQLRCILRS